MSPSPTPGLAPWYQIIQIIYFVMHHTPCFLSWLSGAILDQLGRSCSVLRRSRWQTSWQRETTSDGEQSIHDLTGTSARDDWPVVCEQCQYWFSVRAGDLTGDIQLPTTTMTTWEERGRILRAPHHCQPLPMISIFWGKLLIFQVEAAPAQSSVIQIRLFMTCRLAVKLTILPFTTANL